MREIGFRIWDRIVEKMFYQNCQKMERDGKAIVYFPIGFQFPNEDCWPDTANLILMQYTGLKDKNGKEIYEGDIVKMLSRSLSQVYFADGGFCVDVGGELVGLHPDFLGRYRTVEVIGNIYENPELLKDKK